MHVSERESHYFPMPNKQQQQAIQFGAGPLLVLAGPGSGKTYVITHRIVHLISECSIPPNQILVITFTKAAALEMQHRATSLYHPCSYVQFGTFHSVFYHILRLSNPNRKYVFASDEERITLVKSILETKKNEEKHCLNLPELMQETEACIKAISVYKNRLKEADSNFADNGLPEKYRDIYRQYQAWLNENQKLDFDDMIRLCYLQLKTDEKLCSYWKKRFSHILIDEFQDINPLQYETIKLLNGSDNLFAVGDDDQAIYSFRGAKPELMKCFLEEFHANKICLSVNYRSAAEIIKPAGMFISHNSGRFSKEICAKSDKSGELCLKPVSARQDEYTCLRKEIMNYRKAFPQKTQAVLVRTNGLVNAYSDIIKEKNTDNILTEDMAAYLSFINCGQKRSDFLKIMNKPVRYISASLLSEPVIDFERIKKRLADKPWIQKRVAELQKQIMFAKRLDLEGQARYIYQVMGYGAYMENKIKGCTDGTGNLQKIILDKLKSCHNIREFIENAAEQSSHKPNRNEAMDLNLKLMTYHASKGLEFDRVYLPGLEFGKVPHGRMLQKEELEEERRMFYVALTRAKESLWLFYDKSQTGSPFLQELGCFGSCIL